MDIRAGIVHGIVMALEGKADNNIINLVQDTLIMGLNIYSLKQGNTYPQYHTRKTTDI